jgi:urease accessory protein UreE
MVSGLGGRITRIEAAFDPEFGAYAGAPHHHADDEIDRH